MVNTSINSDYSVEEITQVGRKGRSHGHKYDGADFDESMINPRTRRNKQERRRSPTTSNKTRASSGSATKRRTASKNAHSHQTQE
ncbi:hypothetical protein PMG11_05950 [Penicillium brasilianum]|uniref:Uncharacterized protein n=1 Tax=Penicillium brasilianum TaxID=104259 RepID=A0A0F7TKE9_PENBI|nr:hypothetical protein PMG11_05950 [Penicillium brasilianum]